MGEIRTVLEICNELTYLKESLKMGHSTSKRHLARTHPPRLGRGFNNKRK